MEKKIPTIATHHEASSYSVAISKRYEALCNKWATAHQTLSTKFLNELILPLAQITGHVIETYPAANMEEEALLPAMEDRIYKECNDPLVEMNILLDGLNEKIHDKRTEQELSLLDQVQKRSNELLQKEEEKASVASPPSIEKEIHPSFSDNGFASYSTKSLKPGAILQFDGLKVIYTVNIGHNMTIDDKEVNDWLTARAHLLPISQWKYPKKITNETNLSFLWLSQDENYFTP